MVARLHIGKDNWFLVIPAAILGLVALYTVNRMYRAGDIRRAIEVVVTYQVGTRPPLGEYIQSQQGAIECTARMLSHFYGTLDVACGARDPGPRYRWRVHVGQRAFAPADDVTRELMQAYAPEIFHTTSASSHEDS